MPGMRSVFASPQADGIVEVVAGGEPERGPGPRGDPLAAGRADLEPARGERDLHRGERCARAIEVPPGERVHIATLRFDVSELGLTTSLELKVQFKENGPDIADILVSGYTSMPAVGDCAGGVMIIPGPTTYEWDDNNDILILHEPHGLWRICP